MGRVSKKQPEVPEVVAAASTTRMVPSDRQTAATFDGDTSRDDEFTMDRHSRQALEDRRMKRRVACVL